MSELISRQKFYFSALRELVMSSIKSVSFAGELIEFINELDSQPPADQWIPCDIAVPAEPVGEYYKDVQIKKRSGEVVIGYYRNDDGEWWEIKGDDADRMLDAVEWRPLPEAYKGE